MCDYEQIAQIPHQKWVNERIACFFERIAHSLIISQKNERFAQKLIREFPTLRIALKLLPIWRICDFFHLLGANNNKRTEISATYTIHMVPYQFSNVHLINIYQYRYVFSKHNSKFCYMLQLDRLFSSHRFLRWKLSRAVIQLLWSIPPVILFTWGRVKRFRPLSRQHANSAELLVQIQAQWWVARIKTDAN